jgi:hypothetical protein
LFDGFHLIRFADGDKQCEAGQSFIADDQVFSRTKSIIALKKHEKTGCGNAFITIGKGMILDN